ncbi:hypothetical protein DFP72DRAFT_1066885 [Ephemerocybe angulata]|uniref:DUF6533 domain-containing protein n=1 Tax=Ephemerocybe angulata TaxID=980116 RepID=A0A8H6HZD4_9AGAR|nr:hypothetical protein DFP72DRAFT_1066885 [Tulosesus angulatus]
MSLTPEEIAELTDEVSLWFTQDYISLGFWTFYFHQYLTTLGEEVSTIWPQKWRTGKILFLLLRYIPICYIILAIFVQLRVHMELGPKVCQRVYIAEALEELVFIGQKVIVILLCLHALLGARRWYLALLILIYTGLTIAPSIVGNWWDVEGSRTTPLSELDRELGYGCTWAGDQSPHARKGLVIAGYINLAKATSMAILMLSVFFARRRTTAGTLLHVLRRDSGVHLFSLIASRLFFAMTNSFPKLLGFYSIPYIIASDAQNTVVPILACRLLLNMRKTEDPGVQKSVSSLLFGAPVPGDNSEDNDGDEPTGIPLRPVRRYARLGRQGDAKGGTARHDEETEPPSRASAPSGRSTAASPPPPLGLHAWAAARGLDAAKVHKWWYRCRARAKKLGVEIPEGSCEMDVRDPEAEEGEERKAREEREEKDKRRTVKVKKEVVEEVEMRKGEEEEMEEAKGKGDTPAIPRQASPVPTPPPLAQVLMEVDEEMKNAGEQDIPEASAVTQSPPLTLSQCFLPPSSPYTSPPLHAQCRPLLYRRLRFQIYPISQALEAALCRYEFLTGSARLSFPRLYSFLRPVALLEVKDTSKKSKKIAPRPAKSTITALKTSKPSRKRPKSTNPPAPPPVPPPAASRSSPSPPLSPARSRTPADLEIDDPIPTP